MSNNTITQMNSIMNEDWLRPEVRMHKEKEQILYRLKRVLESKEATTLQRHIAQQHINAVRQEFFMT